MLSEVAGVVIAFITLILLLSILVTTAVQMSQAVLRLRARNLMKGLAALVLKARIDATKEPSKDEVRRARHDATTILNAPDLALINRVAKPTSWQHYWVLGPKVSWLRTEDLVNAVAEQVPDLADGAPDIGRDFERSQTALQKRFLRIVRLWTLGWALTLAFVFQVSTPALLGELARDADSRTRVLAGVDDVLVFAEGTTANAERAAASGDALRALQIRYPSYHDAIARAADTAERPDFTWEALAIALQDVPDHDAILDDYERLLEGSLQSQLSSARSEAEGSLSRLSSLGLVAWPEGWAFYVDAGDVRLNNLLGVLITAILLSLGAPFWFAQLKNVASFRDVLAGARGATASVDSRPDGQPSSAATSAQTDRQDD